MNLFGVGTGELLLILLIALLVMGPERLPQLARQWAKIVKMTRRISRTWYEVNAELNRQLDLEERERSKPATGRRPSTPPVTPQEVENNSIAPPQFAQPADLEMAPEPPPVVSEPVEPGTAPNPLPETPDE